MRKQIIAAIFGLTFISSVLLLSATHASAATSKLLYVNYDGVSTMDVNTINSDGTSSTNLTNGGASEANGQWGVEWSPDGTKIAFVRSSISGAPFNLYVMNADGSGLLQLTNDGISGPFGMSWSPDGTKIAYVTYDSLGPAYNINTINVDGTGSTALTNTNLDICPQWTAGNKIAFVTFRDGNTEIYTMNSDGSNQTNISNNSNADGLLIQFCALSVSPDGTKVAFSTDRDGPGNTYDIYSMNIDGSNQTALTANNPTGEAAFPEWSNDGTKIAYGSNNDDLGSGPNGFQVYTMNADGSNETRLTSSGGNVLVTNSLFGSIEWSPDDSQIAFSSNRNGGGFEVFLMNADGSNQTALVGSGINFSPRWQPLQNNNGGGTTGGGSSGSPASAGTLANTGDNTQIMILSGVSLVVIGTALLIRAQKHRLTSLVRHR